MKPFTTLTIVVLVVFAFIHLLRLMLEWRVIINDAPMPMWASGAALIGALALAGLLWWENRR